MTAVAPAAGQPWGVPSLRSLGAVTPQEVMLSNAGRPRFLVEGLIHASTTLVYGLSEAGKSWLMVDLIAAAVRGDTWLGQQVNGGPQRCLVLPSDSGGTWEYAERLGDGLGDAVLLHQPPPVDVRTWSALAEAAASDHIGLVVVDNLYSWARAVDMNANAEVAVPLACLGALANVGIAVVLVHHTNSGGRKPAGVHSIPAYFRHSLEVHRERVRSHGNDTATATYPLRRDGGRVIEGSPTLDLSPTDGSASTPPAGVRAKAQDRYQRAIAALQEVPHLTSAHAKGKHLATVMQDVQTAEAGRQIVRTMERNGLLPKP